MANDRFLRACRREAVDTVPVWIMRQAGRYLPEYLEVRSKHSFLAVCKTPELAAQVTLQPVDRLGVDAAILFSDILIPVEAMGVPLEFHEGHGPRLGRVDFSSLRVPDPLKETRFVMDAIRMLRRELAGKVPLIGFSGLPFTLASYIVEGGKSKDFKKLTGLMTGSPEEFRALMDKLALTVTDYVNAQIEAGAQAVQLFDTWAGILSRADYEEHVLPFTQRILAGLRRSGVPVIHYANDCAKLLPAIAALPVDVIAVDWRIPMDEAASVVGRGFALQGNLDPQTLLRGREEVEAGVEDVLRRGRAAASHIFNLGYGILPQTDPERAMAMVEAVHRLGRRT